MNSSDLESHTPSKKSNSLTLDNIHQEEGGIAAEHQQSGIYGLTRKLMSFVVPANQSQTKEMSANVLESGLAGVSGRAEYPQAVPAGYMVTLITHLYLLNDCVVSTGAFQKYLCSRNEPKTYVDASRSYCDTAWPFTAAECAPNATSGCGVFFAHQPDNAG